MGRRRVVRHLRGLLACIGLAGCAVSDPTQYYTLGQPAARNTESRAMASTPRSSMAASTVSIGVGPVIMPSYLDRTQIVTRTAADQLDLANFHRWAEPLQEGIVRVLAE